jgi:hypothetical protein
MVGGNRIQKSYFVADLHRSGTRSEIKTAGGRLGRRLNAGVLGSGTEAWPGLFEGCIAVRRAVAQTVFRSKFLRWTMRAKPAQRDEVDTASIG